MNAIILFLLVGVALLPLDAADLPNFPSKPGVYETNGWKYEYVVHLKGSRSESRTGRLFFNGHEITAPAGIVTNTPLGRFRFHRQPYNSGWLNTLTYDYPVFDQTGAGSRDGRGQTNSMPRRLSSKEVIDVLEQHGFCFVSQKGGHAK